MLFNRLLFHGGQHGSISNEVEVNVLPLARIYGKPETLPLVNTCGTEESVTIAKGINVEGHDVNPSWAEQPQFERVALVRPVRAGLLATMAALLAHEAPSVRNVPKPARTGTVVAGDAA